MVAALPGVRIGQNCEVAVEGADGYGEYKTYIEDLRDDRLVVAMPTSRGQYVNPSTGTRLELRVPTPGGGTLYLDCELVARQTSPVPMLVLRVIAVGQQQSRGYFRIPVVVRPFDCAVWDHAGGPEFAHWRPVRVAIQDLSGGGAGLLADEQLPEGARVRLRFPVPFGGGECAATGQVKMSRRHGVSQATREPRWIAGVQFDEITRQAREGIVKAVHRIQAEERRAAAEATV
jgi:c-di-GMP-binding flagellar brake protein YcgR